MRLKIVEDTICRVFGHWIKKSGHGLKIKHQCRLCGWYIQSYYLKE